MEKKNYIIVIGLICFVGFLLYVSKNRVETSPKNTNAPTQNANTLQSQSPPEDQAKVQDNAESKEISEEVQAVEIPPEKQQLIGVKIVEAAVKPLQKTIRTVGRVEYDERKLTSVNIKVEGWVEKLYAD